MLQNIYFTILFIYHPTYIEILRERERGTELHFSGPPFHFVASTNSENIY